MMVRVINMTDRLYYNDSYLTEFDATVVEVRQHAGKTIVALDRSAFYPTSGGQPFDTGTLNDAHVTDVFVEKDGVVWHEIDGELQVGDAVYGKIDWARRFEHMQQHAADHMIAGAIWALYGGVTIGLHLGEAVSTIDVEFADGRTHLTDEMIGKIEDTVNAQIQSDAAILCWFPEPDEIATLPMRKKPTVKEHVRVVAMGDFEMVACGGTHPSTTGQIGLIKIVGAAPARGKLRVSFLAGMRAYQDYRANYNFAWNAANLLSSRPETLEKNIESLQARLRDAEKALSELRREKLYARIPQLLADAENLPDAKLVCAKIEADAQSMREFASKLIESEPVVALLAAEADGKYNYVFACSAGLNYNMGKLLSEAAKPLGGKGGGRPDFAQGGGPLEAIYKAAEAVKNA